MPTHTESSTPEKKEHHNHTTHPKPRDKRVLIAVAILVVCGILYYFRGLFIVAMVNGQPISRMALIKQMNKQYGQKTADTLVNRAIILQQAKKQKITVTDKEVDQEIKKVETSLQAQGQKLDTVLTLQGMDRQTFREQMYLQKVIEKMLDKSVKVSDAEVDKYIADNKLVLENGPADKQVKDNVREQIKQQKLNDSFQSWLNDLRKKAKIDYWTSF